MLKALFIYKFRFRWVALQFDEVMKCMSWTNKLTQVIVMGLERGLLKDPRQNLSISEFQTVLAVVRLFHTGDNGVRDSQKHGNIMWKTWPRLGSDIAVFESYWRYEHPLDVLCIDGLSSID